MPDKQMKDQMLLHAASEKVSLARKLAEKERISLEAALQAIVAVRIDRVIQKVEHVELSVDKIERRI